MVNSVQNNSYYIYNGQEYRRRSEGEEILGYFLATAASSIVLKALPPFSNPFLRQITKEHGNNHLYKDAFFKAMEKSGLAEKNVKFVDMQFVSKAEEAAYKAGEDVLYGDIKAGLNACYIPKYKDDLKIVALNSEKTTISGFHELGHAMNHLKSNFGKILQKCRIPGYYIAGIMGVAAIISRPKPKDAPKNAFDWVQDNCGKLAFAAMLPTVAEEALASYKGIKLARQSGLSEPLVKNLKRFYGKAFLSYFGYALLTGVSVYIMSKITEIFTRPKKITKHND